MITASRFIFIQPTNKCYSSCPSRQFLLRTLSTNAELLQIHDLKAELKVCRFDWAPVFGAWLRHVASVSFIF